MANLENNRFNSPNEPNAGQWLPPPPQPAEVVELLHWDEAQLLCLQGPETNYIGSSRYQTYALSEIAQNLKQPKHFLGFLLPSLGHEMLLCPSSCHM